LKLTQGAAYFHYTTNETISGAQWKTLPKTDAPLVADVSSDILSRPMDMAPFSLIYAGAQKNLGPSGVTLVLIRKSFAERSNKSVPAIFRYPTHIEAQSLYNTPPTFGVYVLMLVTRWMKRVGLEKLFKQNADKAALLYDVIDASEFDRGTAAEECRSDMNVTFRLPSAELESEFCATAKKAGLDGLKGHRSVGGVRASIYNAFPVEGVRALAHFMKEFEKTRG
jgi:phosphoserine aminotransferase